MTDPPDTPGPRAAAGRAVPLPIGTRVVRNPVEPSARRPPRLGTVMCHAQRVCSRGLFSVRWDDRIWEANLDVTDVTTVPQEQAPAAPLSRSPRGTRAVG